MEDFPNREENGEILTRTTDGGYEGSAPFVLKKKARLHPRLGITALAIAVVFFFLPDIAIFDFLPDFFGYVILLIGMAQLRDMNGYFEEAYNRFFKMAIVSLAKILSFFIVMGLVTPAETPDTLLLLTFTYAIFDFVFLIPAWNQFFEGFSYLTARHGSAEFELHHYRKRRYLSDGTIVMKKPKNRIESLRKYTVFFVVLKSVLSVLPEFSALTADVELNTTVMLYDFIGLLRTFAMIPVIVFGIVYLVKVCSFVTAVKRDAEFISRMKEIYRTDVLTKDWIFTRRHIKTALLFAAVAVVFRVDFRIDHLHVIPDVLLGILLIAAVLTFGRDIGKRGRFFLSAAFFSILSAVNIILEYRFHYLHSVTSIQTNSEAYDDFNLLLSSKVLEEGLFVIMMLCFFFLLRYVVQNHTGFSVNEKETSAPSEKVRAIRRELEKELKLVMLLSIVSAVSKVLLIALSLEMRMGEELDWLPIVDVAISALFAGFSIKAVRDIYTQVEYRFMLM